MNEQVEYKPILCLDFDGVLHSYKSGWQGADVISDEPVPGAQEFVKSALIDFDVVVHSSRCHQEGGMQAIIAWLNKWGFPPGVLVASNKPGAHVTLDDRAITFNGQWPSIRDLVLFKPWYKR